MYGQGPGRTVRSAPSCAPATQPACTWWIEISCVISFCPHLGDKGTRTVRAAVNDGIYRTMLDQQITFLIIYVSPHPLISPPSLSTSVSYQGDAGETGEPGLQGEVGPPVSYSILFPPYLHELPTKNGRTNNNFTTNWIIVDQYLDYKSDYLQWPYSIIRLFNFQSFHCHFALVFVLQKTFSNVLRIIPGSKRRTRRKGRGWSSWYSRASWP